MMVSVYIYNYSTEVPFQIAPGGYAQQRIKDLISQTEKFHDANTKHYPSTENSNWALVDTNRVTLISEQHINNLIPGSPRPKGSGYGETRYAVVPLELCKPHSWSILAEFLRALGVKLPDGPLASLPTRYICMEEDFRYYTLWIRDFTLPWDVAVYSTANNPTEGIQMYPMARNIGIAQDIRYVREPPFSGIVKWLFRQETGISERKVHPITTPNRFSYMAAGTQFTEEALNWAVVDLGSGTKEFEYTSNNAEFKPRLIHHVTIDNNSDCLRNNMHYLVLPFTHSTPTLAKMLSRHLLQKGLNGWREYLIRGEIVLNTAVDDTGPAATEGRRELYKFLD